MRQFFSPYSPQINRNWSKDHCYVNELPSSIYLTYRFENQGMHFAISGGHDAYNIVSFETFDKVLFNEIKNALSPQIPNITKPFRFEPRNELEFSYNTISPVEEFINELNSRFPFPTAIKQDLDSSLLALDSYLKKEDEESLETSLKP